MTPPSFNSVRLIGRVYRAPKSFDSKGESFVRVVLEVDEQDEEGSFFSSYHVVILSDEMVAADGGVNLGDMIMVDGRLNNYKVSGNGHVFTNVHAKAILVLMRNSERVERLLGQKAVGDPDDECQPASHCDGNVVSLFGDDHGDDEPPF